MNIVSIPTQYAGVNFRSRLEAKWAAFFDIVKWDWEYEPCDFKGWIPDFVIQGEKPIFVEVKPIMKGERSFEAEADIERADIAYEALILGVSPQIEEFGWFAEIYDEKFTSENTMRYWWQPAAFGIWSDHVYSFCASEGSFTSRITGKHDGGCYGGDGILKEHFDQLWRAAGNACQWKRSK